MKLLCYVRPWNIHQFQCLAENIAPHGTISYCSEHRSVDRAGLSDRYYRYLSAPSSISGLSVSTVEDFIARCRLLRALRRDVAVMHLSAMSLAVRDLLDKVKPSVVLSLTVDSFLIDLLRLHCSQNGIRFIGLVPTFVNGYFRVTSRGEATCNPSADYNDLGAIKESLLNPAYAPAFNAKSLARPVYSTIRRWSANVARVPYFLIKRRVQRDRYNYHYWSAQLVSLGLFSILPPIDPGDKNWNERLRRSDKPVLYIPLQMFPEATIDYWCDSVAAVRYYERLETLIDRHHDAFQIVVKEHPSVMGSRPPGFYRRLANDRRVIVVPTYTSSNMVLEEANSVLVWTGTVGFEAALRGIPVICVGRPYYASGPRFLDITERTTSDAILAHVRNQMSVPVTTDEQDALIRHLLSQFYRGAFKNDGTWAVGDAKDFENCRIMARSLRSLIEHKEA